VKIVPTDAITLAVIGALVQARLSALEMARC
jgi:hypothetical protein